MCSTVLNAQLCDSLAKRKDGVSLSVWNFAPLHLDAPSNILIQNQNMAANLAVLSMHLQAQMKPKMERE